MNCGVVEVTRNNTLRGCGYPGRMSKMMRWRFITKADVIDAR